MKGNLWYPTVQEVIKANKLMVDKFRATKAEKHQVLNRKQIEEAIKEAKEYDGDIQDKASVLLRNLQYHPFASANRRTAYYIMNKFLWRNASYCLAKDEDSGRDFMRKVRRGELNNAQIKEIIKIGEDGDN